MKTITARPCGHYRDGSPIRVHTYLIDREPEPFSEGHSRIFAENATFPRPDGRRAFTPVVVFTDTIQAVAS